jgi:hypothetical protein
VAAEALRCLLSKIIKVFDLIVLSSLIGRYRCKAIYTAIVQPTSMGPECLYSQHQTGRSCSHKRASNARHVE